MVHYPLVRKAMTDTALPPQTETPTLAQLADRAEQLLAHGRSHDALAILDQLAERAPSEPQVYYLRAQATRQAGGVKAAFVDVRTALALARRQGLDLRALQALSDELKQELSDEVPLLAVSRATATLRRLIADDKQRSAEELTDTLLPHFGTYRALLQLAAGLSRFSRGRADQAIADLEAAVESSPSLWPAAYACGHALLSVGDRQGALAAFAHTAVQHRQAVSGFVLSEAEDLLLATAGLAFSARGFGFERASLLHSLGHSDEAIAVLNELLRDEPEAADAHLSKAVLLKQSGRLEEALDSLQLAESTLQPEDRRQEIEDPLRRIQLLRIEVLHGLLRHDEAQALAEQLATVSESA